MRRRFAILAECARRMLPMYGLPAALIVGLEWLRRIFLVNGEPFDIGSPASVTALGMTAAWLLAVVAAGHLRPREIIQLPVTRRDVWVCHWWLAVVASGAVMGTAAAIGAMLANAGSDYLITARDVVLTAVCSAGWGGLYLVRRPRWLTLTPLDRLPPHSSARKLAGIAIVVMVLGWFVGGAVLPFAIAPLIVHAAGAGSIASYVLAIAVTALILTPYFHTPPVKERPPIVRAGRPGTASKMSAPAPASSPEWLTGLRVMYWGEIRRYLWLFSFGMAAAVGYWWVFDTTQTFVEFLRANWLLPFSGPGSKPATTLIMLFVMLGAASPQGNDVRRELRRLRTLPLSSRSLSNALLFRTMIGPLMLWIAGLLLHVIALRAVPMTLRLDVLLLALGVWAMMHAASLAIAGRRTAQSAVFASLLFAGVALGLFMRDARPSMALAGGVLLVSAWWSSEWAIGRQSRLYARSADPTTVAETRFS